MVTNKSILRTVRFDAGIYRALKVHAVASDEQLWNLINRILAEYLKNKRKNAGGNQGRAK